MCSERNAELNQLIKQYLSVSNIRNMKSGILRKVLSQLMRLTFQGTKTRTRSVLIRNTRRSRAKTTNWVNIEKILENRSKKTKRYNGNTLLPVFKIHPYPTRNNSSVSSSTNLKQKKVPIVYLKDVLTTQGRVSKPDFLEYFGLQKSDTENYNHSENISNFGMVKFSQAVNIPITSNLGRMMAARENHSLSEDFKLRKIDRCEWYINKPFNKKEETIEFPVTYVDKSRKKTETYRDHKFKDNVGNLNQLLRLCKPVSVNLDKLNLLELRRRLLKNAKRRKLYRERCMKKKCQDFKVIVKGSEKKKVDELFQKKF